MVGAEILNREYKNEFHTKNNIFIILPTCMEINKEKCQAKKEIIGSTCVSCNKNCKINNIKK